MGSALVELSLKWQCGIRNYALNDMTPEGERDRVVFSKFSDIRCK